MNSIESPATDGTVRSLAFLEMHPTDVQTTSRTGILPEIAPHPPVIFPILPPEPAREYLRPGYTAAFRCIASACEDTCCQGWSVPVDRATYEKYASSEPMKPHLGTTIHIKPNCTTPADFARIAIKNDYACAFLGTDKLCSIQKTLGPTMLSDTCATYPRQRSTHAGAVEEALNLSCPEAARLTLLSPPLIGDNAYATSNRYASFLLDAETSPASLTATGYDPRLATREFALLLLADPRYPMWQRLFLLGTLTHRLQALSGTGSVSGFAVDNPGKIAELLGDTAHIVAQGGMIPVMNGIDVRPLDQLALILELVRMRVADSPVGTRFRECLEEFELGIGCETADNEQQILDRYTEAYRRFYRPAMQRHPHLLENYVANYIFKNHFPFRAETDPTAGSAQPVSDPSREHLLLCVHVALVQTLLVGIAAHRREAFDAGDIVKLVQSLAKTFEHAAPFLIRISQWVVERNLKSSHGVLLLLKEDA